MEVSGIWPSEAEEIRDASIVGGSVDGAGNLVLVNHGGATFNAGVVRPPPVEPGRATWLSDGVMNNAPTGAGTFWYTPTFVGALSDVVEYGGVGAMFQTSVNTGIKVMQDGTYDISGYVWTNSGYPVGNIVGVRLVTPSAGMDNYAEFGTKPPNLVSGAVNVHAFRKALPANTTLALQIHASNAGGVAWGDWRAMIQVRKSW